MSIASVETVKKLPLHSSHLKLNAKMGCFGDWEVPLYYSTILQEHQAVRTQAGLFDVSHMGEFIIRGEAASSFLNYLLPREIEKMEAGRALYMPLLNEHGGIVDDLILYRIRRDDFLMIVNAGNLAKDFEWILKQYQQVRQSFEALEIINMSDSKGLLALQGPQGLDIMERAFPGLAKGIKPYGFIEWDGGVLARTGYTGEDGFELMIDAADLENVWDELLKAGAALGLVPAGFGARDTLRLEAGMPLHGHDIDETTLPLEAGLDWTVSLVKGNYVGRNALLQAKEQGIRKRLIGFEMIARGIPRQHHEIIFQDKQVGTVTSGSFAPTLQKNIGMGYIESSLAREGQEIEIQIRQQKLAARVVRLPFYRRPGR